MQKRNEIDMEEKREVQNNNIIEVFPDCKLFFSCFVFFLYFFPYIKESIGNCFFSNAFPSI